MQPIVFKKELIDETLQLGSEQGKRSLDPFSAFAKEAGANVALIELNQDASRAEVHRGSVDFFQCLEGEVEFVTGGTLVEPFLREYEDGTINELEVRAPSIVGGDVTKLVSGDMLWIPNGLPHSNRTDTHARLLVIKIPAKEVYQLENIAGWK